MKYIGSVEQNVGVVTREDIPDLVCDVGIRVANSKLTLCYLGNMVMCDLDLVSSEVNRASIRASSQARKILYKIVVSVAEDFADVVVPQSAVPVDTPK
eukprot:1051590-Pleurochrysis_carterae.AAC.1